MGTTLTINGVGYTFPAVGDKPWAQNVINWATAITNGVLQKSGGSFTLLADIDFGANFGIKSIYYKSRDAAVASAGVVRLGNGESISWRDAGDSTDFDLKCNTSDLLEFAGTEIATHATVSKAVYNYLVGVTSSIQTQLNAKLSDPLTTNGDVVIRAGGVTTRLAAGSAGEVLKMGAAVPEWGTVAGSGDVVGPASVVDEADVIFDGTTGKLIKERPALVVTTDGSDPGVGGMSISTITGAQYRATTGFVDVTDLTATITTRGRPVMIAFIPTNADTTSYWHVQKNGAVSVSNIGANYRILRDAVIIARQSVGFSFPADTSTSHIIQPEAAIFNLVDFPAAGTYVYKVMFEAASTNSNAGVVRIRMMVYEL